MDPTRPRDVVVPDGLRGPATSTVMLLPAAVTLHGTIVAPNERARVRAEPAKRAKSEAGVSSLSSEQAAHRGRASKTP